MFVKADPEGLAAIVHAEFDRMGCVFVCLDLFHFQGDITIDLVFGKHVTCQQIVVIGGQLFHGFAQRIHREVRKAAGMGLGAPPSTPPQVRI